MRLNFNPHTTTEVKERLKSEIDAKFNDLRSKSERSIEQRLVDLQKLMEARLGSGVILAAEAKALGLTQVQLAAQVIAKAAEGVAIEADREAQRRSLKAKIDNAKDFIQLSKLKDEI